MTNTFRDENINIFMERLASSSPTPGGGVAAALIAATGAALIGMVSSLTLGKKAYAQHQELAAYLVREASGLRNTFLELADEDALAYSSFGIALAMPKSTPEEAKLREDSLQLALLRSADVPTKVMRECKAGVVLINEARGRTNKSVASDLDVAFVALEAASRCAWINVEVNLSSIRDREKVEQISLECEVLRDFWSLQSKLS